MEQMVNGLKYDTDAAARGWRKLQQRMRTLKSIEPLLVSMPKISGHGIAATIPTCPENCYIVCSSYNIYIRYMCI